MMHSAAWVPLPVAELQRGGVPVAARTRCEARMTSHWALPNGSPLTTFKLIFEPYAASLRPEAVMSSLVGHVVPGQTPSAFAVTEKGMSAGRPRLSR